MNPEPSVLSEYVRGSRTCQLCSSSGGGAGAADHDAGVDLPLPLVQPPPLPCRALLLRGLVRLPRHIHDTWFKISLKNKYGFACVPSSKSEIALSYCLALKKYLAFTDLIGIVVTVIFGISGTIFAT